MYGDIAEVGAGNAILIVLQLTLASLVTILLDDMLGKGYGIGNSATSIFIAINMAETIIWNCFSPLSFKTNTGSSDLEQYEGAFVELFYGIWFRESKMGAIQDALFRDSLPNLSNVLGTVFVFLIVIYFQGFKVVLPLANNKTTSRASYPIRLFYTSNMPIILMSALVSNVYFFSQMLYRNFKGSFITSIFGSWQEAGYQGQIVPVGGLIYYITSPRTLYDALTDPIHTLFYFLFVVGSCALFSKTWISVSGQGPKEICDNLKNEGMTVTGYTQSGTYQKLSMLINVAALLGGIFTGTLTIFADFLGAIGSGTGILLSVTIIYGLYEDIVK
jgi:protein transport protein SEC61 subunit alpha